MKLENAALEHVDDALNEVDLLVEMFNNGSPCYSVLPERYLDDDLSIMLTIRGPGRFHDTVNFIAVIQGVFVGGFEHQADVTPSVPEFCRHDRREIGFNSPYSGPYRNDGLVFVCNVEAVEFPEHGVPSLVWFERPEDARSLQGNAMYLSSASGPQTLQIPIDRKSRGIGGCSVVMENGRIDDVIVGGANVVDSIAYDDCEKRWDWFACIEPKDLVARLRIVLRSDGVWAGIEEGFEYGLELLDVALGPLDFNPCAKKRIM